jgi:hypothetical protein
VAQPSCALSLTLRGLQVAQQPFDMLFEAAWVPAPAGTYEDRPQSPERLAQATSPTGAGGGARPAAGAARPAGYVPPHLRGAGERTNPGCTSVKVVGFTGIVRCRPIRPACILVCWGQNVRRAHNALLKGVA